MNNYEITFITLENLSEKPFKDALDLYSGHILSISSIGERQFAYPIKKETRGVYTTVLFEMDPDKLSDLNRKLTLTDEILRFLITAKKPSAMKALEEAAAKANEVAPIEITAPKVELPAEEIKEIAAGTAAPVEIEAPIEIEEPKEIEQVELPAEEKEEVREPARSASSTADAGGEKPKAVKKTVKKAEKVEALVEKKASKEVTEIETETESEEDRLKELDKKLDELLKD